MTETYRELVDHQSCRSTPRSWDRTRLRFVSTELSRIISVALTDDLFVRVQELIRDSELRFNPVVRPAFA